MYRVTFVLLKFEISGKFCCAVLMVCVAVVESPPGFLCSFGYKTYMAAKSVNKSRVQKMCFPFVSWFYLLSSSTLALLCFILSHVESHPALILPVIFTWIAHSKWGCSTVSAISQYLLLVLTSLTSLFINELTFFNNCNSQHLFLSSS